MSKCEITKCDNDVFKSIPTKVVNPNKNDVSNISIGLCKEHYDKIMGSSALNQSFSIRATGDKNGKNS